ncbi:MAG: 2-dehydropantoate 2-reductase [Proteobacteria bacterium]|nr:2-dehydropantoate 2-reductase [Pseudomonadota bacterium]
MKELSGRFIIYGAGAIGSVFGGMLTRGGHRVELVGRPDHMKAAQKEGLFIEGLLGDHVIHPSGMWTSLEKIPGDPPVRAIFICVKSNDTAFAVRDLAGSGLVSPETQVVSLQNGLGNLEKIRKVFGPEVSLGGRVIFGAETKGPGRVFVSVWADNVLIGGPSSEEGAARGEELAGILSRCGIQTRFTGDIESALWVKVLYNVGLNPLSSLLEVPYGVLGEEENARFLLEESIREAFRVASRETDTGFADEESYLDHFFTKLLPATRSHHSSMLQDMKKGRDTEVDAITGEVVRRGLKYGIPTPVNGVLLDLVNGKTGIRKKESKGK